MEFCDKHPCALIDGVCPVCNGDVKNKDLKISGGITCQENRRLRVAWHLSKDASTVKKSKRRKGG